ncbi:hypothetical protein V1514DRAFT_325419 [Lipomyces japonicus]|uniref:uncharacterized protein n=1 Tax=Lipomyces japonicus TaxID=56871 RepID=UPI0034CF0925
MVKMNRVALSIRSNIPEEMDWALQSLVKMSFETPDQLSLERYPGLAHALLEKLSSVGSFAGTMDTYQVNNGSTYENTEDDLGITADKTEAHEKLAKVLEAALILRNTSINPENARYLASVRSCGYALVKSLNLPESPSLVELRQYTLDITESVALFLRPYSVEDQLFQALLSFLGTEDRGVLVSSLRGIARLVISTEGNLLQVVNVNIIKRICSLILLDDEELLSVCLDFLYQFTAYPENIDKTSDTIGWRDPVQQLMRLTLYQAQEIRQVPQPLIVPQLVQYPGNPYPQPSQFVPGVSPNIAQYPILSRPVPPIAQPVASQISQPAVNYGAAPPDPPVLPDDLVRELVMLEEPNRATYWMRSSFEEDPDGDVTQIALWKAYEGRFDEFVKQGRKLLPAADFIKNVTNAFKRAAAMVVTQPNGQQKFIIKGIRPRVVPLSLKGEFYVGCEWVVGENERHCNLQFPSVADLYAHIGHDHVLKFAKRVQPVQQVPVEQFSSGQDLTTFAEDVTMTDAGLTHNVTASLQPVTTGMTVTPGSEPTAVSVSHQFGSPIPGQPIIAEAPVANGQSNVPLNTERVDQSSEVAQISERVQSAEGGFQKVEEISQPEEEEEDDDDDESSREPIRNVCKWNNCGRFGPEGELDRRLVIAHIRTHIPEPKRPSGVGLQVEPVEESHLIVTNSLESQKVILTTKSTVVDENGDAIGIPLTASLILRNIARSKTGKEILRGWVETIISIAELNISLRGYITDLLTIIDQDDVIED